MGTRSYKLQACVETLQEAILAEQRGADELEFCSRLDLDGLTPDLVLVKQVLESVSIPIHVMIRPRGGNFEYTEEEVVKMEQSIYGFNTIGIAGVVLGASINDAIDISTLQRLIEKVDHRLIITLHKVIDTVADPMACITDIKNTSVRLDRILSSGGKRTAEQGIFKLKEMRSATEGYCKIIAAGKITKDNLGALHHKLRLQFYHGRRIV